MQKAFIEKAPPTKKLAQPVKSREKSVRSSTGNRRDNVAHKAILDAAVALIAEKGPKGFAMEAVAKLAGVGKPTIYRWWPDRTDLLLELFNREILLPPEIPEDADLATELKLRYREMFRAWRETDAGRVFRSLMIEMQSSPDTIARFKEEALATRRAHTRTAFERAQRNGEIPATKDLSALVDVLYGWAWYRLLTGQLIPDAAFDAALEAIAAGAKTALPPQPSGAITVKKKTR